MFQIYYYGYAQYSFRNSHLYSRPHGMVSPHLTVGIRERLAKNGVHWQNPGTSSSSGKANEPTRDILPEYGLPRKGSN